MTSNAEQIKQAIHSEFAQMLDFVTNEAAYSATADHIERGLFGRLLALGRQLLQLFFMLRAQQSAADTFATPAGVSLPYHADRERNYVSIFGKVVLWRAYFYAVGVGGALPLDAELSLGSDSHSDMVRELTDYLGVYGVYHKTTEILHRIFNLSLSTRTVEGQILADATDVTAYYAQKPPPAAASEAAILVIQADGKGIPLILEASAPPAVRLGKGEKRGNKKEAVVTTAYTIAAAPRTPEMVVQSYYNLPLATVTASVTRTAPQHKQVWATLEGKDTALERLAQQVTLREGDHIQHRVALCDGCEALQTRLATHFPAFTQILDFIHANEYLWDVANSLLGETNDARWPWMQAHTQQLLTGNTRAVIGEFRQLAGLPTTTAAQQRQLERTANYFERNLTYMDYATYLAQGWPIASGVIEGACRHFVKDRCELSGMRWSLNGAEQLLHLRAVAENDDWEAYHDFRKRARHQRLYHQPFPTTASPETLALAA